MNLVKALIRDEDLVKVLIRNEEFSESSER